MSEPFTSEQLREAAKLLDNQPMFNPRWENFEEFLTKYVAPVYGQARADSMREYYWSGQFAVDLLKLAEDE